MAVRCYCVKTENTEQDFTDSGWVLFLDALWDAPRLEDIYFANDAIKCLFWKGCLSIWASKDVSEDPKIPWKGEQPDLQEPLHGFLLLWEREAGAGLCLGLAGFALWWPWKKLQKALGQNPYCMVPEEAALIESNSTYKKYAWLLV